jgi:hypothetical protein
MKYFEKISALPDRNVIKYLPIKLPTSPRKSGKFFKTVSDKIGKISTKGLD